jgi:hypothetical protein
MCSPHNLLAGTTLRSTRTVAFGTSLNSDTVVEPFFGLVMISNVPLPRSLRSCLKLCWMLPYFSRFLQLKTFLAGFRFSLLASAKKRQNFS